MGEIPLECLKRWTGDECRRLVEADAVENPEWIELIDGLLYHKHRTTPRHRQTQWRTSGALQEVYGLESLVLGGIALFLSERDEPEPDFMVVPSGGRGIPVASEVRLIVEVSEVTLSLDQTLKAALYARHGIPEYLILDVTNRRAEIRRRPQGEVWGETLILTEDGTFTPLGASAPLCVADLLPDRETPLPSGGEGQG